MSIDIGLIPHYNDCMQVTLIYANTLRAAKMSIDEKIRKLNHAHLDYKNFIIVPEKSTLDAERALITVSGGSFNTNVVTFKKLVDSLIDIKQEYLTRQNCIILLSRLIDSISSSFLCYKHGANSSGFAEKIYQLISAFKYAHISPEQLSIGDLPQSLATKLHDIKLIYSAYIDALKDKYIDSADKLDILIDALTPKTIGGYGFYIYDFLSFTVQEKLIIQKLIKNSSQVTVAAATSRFKTHSALFDNSIPQAIQGICNNLNIKPHIENYVTHASEVTKHIHTSVFCVGKTTKKTISPDKLIIKNCTDMFEEVLKLAQFIDVYAKKGGRYKDIKVLCPDISLYGYAIDKYFSDYNIPFYLDKKESLINSVLGKYVLSFLNAYKNNFKLSFVLDFAKNYLFKEDVCAFENFCIKYNVSFNYSDLNIGLLDPHFAQAAAIGKKLTALFDRYDIKKADTCKNYINKISNFLTEENIVKKLEEYGEMLNSYGIKEEERRIVQAEKKLRQVLDQLAAVMENEYLTLDKFIKAFSAALNAATISIVPLYFDCVNISDLNKGVSHSVKTLAVIGTNEGSMPVTKKSGTLLTDSNIEILKSYGLNADISTESENKRQRFKLFNALNEPTDILYVSYCDFDTDSQTRPAPFVNALKKCFTVDGVSDYPNSVIDYEYHNKETAFKKVLISLRQNREKLADLTQPMEEYQRKALQYLDFNKVITHIPNGKELFFKGNAYSVTKIESFYNCPFSHFVSSGLGLKEKETGQFKVNDFGNILHSVFEKFVNKIINKEKAEEQAAEEIFDEVINDEKYIAFKNDFKFDFLSENLKKETVKMCMSISEQIANSDFFPIKTEFRFGFDADNMLTMECLGKTLSLKGVIDRIDAYGENYMIIDYKSGKANFSESKLYLGIKLQLFVYALALKKYFKGTPVACFYFKVSDDYNESDKKRFIGRVVADKELIGSIDKDFNTKGKSKLFSASLKKDGTLSNIGKSAITREQFDACAQYALALITKANKLMQRGYVAVNPIDKACTYCLSKNLCNFNDTLIFSPRKEVQISAEDISRCMEENSNA